MADATRQKATEPGLDDDVILQVGPAHDVADGSYSARTIQLATFEWESPEGPKPLLRWTFAVDVGEADWLELEGVTSVSTGPKSRAFRWMTSLVGAEAMSKARAWRGKELIGLPCVVSVEHDANGYPRVSEVLAPMRGK